MNKVMLMGRLTKDPDIRYGANNAPVGKYTLAVDRRFKRDGQPDTDFIPCTAFGKQAEFAEKYLCRGKKIAVSGRIETGSYTNKDGQKVYTTDVIVEEQEFVESKSAEQGGSGNAYDSGTVQAQDRPDDDGFMNLPETDDELPFA